MDFVALTRTTVNEEEAKNIRCVCFVYARAILTSRTGSGQDNIPHLRI